MRYRIVQSISEALQIAISDQEAERQERSDESFYTKVEKSARSLCRSPSRTRAGNGIEQHSADVVRSITHVLSEIGLQEMPAGLRPQAIGTAD